MLEQRWRLLLAVSVGVEIKLDFRLYLFRRSGEDAIEFREIVFKHLLVFAVTRHFKQNLHSIDLVIKSFLGIFTKILSWEPGSSEDLDFA